MFLSYYYQETSEWIVLWWHGWVVKGDWNSRLSDKHLQLNCNVIYFSWVNWAQTGSNLHIQRRASSWALYKLEQPYLSMVLYHIPTEVQKDTKDDRFNKPVVWWTGVQNPTEVFCGSLMSFCSEQVMLLYWVGSPLMTIPGSEKWKNIISFKKRNNQSKTQSFSGM